jgi:protein-tyrosine phosphatase
VEVDSAGTGDWHIGEQADHRALAALTDGGYDGSAHRARQFDPHWFAVRDLVVALDRGHVRALRSWAPNERDRAKVRLLRSFDPALAGRVDADLDLTDPYEHGADVFAETLRQVEGACAGLLQYVREALDRRDPQGQPASPGDGGAQAGVRA